MFTVIFAEKETIKLFEETKMFFGPLYNSEQVAFCEWNKDAKDFSAMVPDLYELIEHQSEWRAIVLCADDIEKHNPFDYTGYKEPFGVTQGDWDYLRNRRSQRIASYEKAVSSPLVRFTTALSDIPGFVSMLSADDYSQIMSGELQTYEYMLRMQLDAVNLHELTLRLGRYQRDGLMRFVSEDRIEPLLEFMRAADVSAICSMIPDTAILDFIRFIGNEPMYFDPEYTECLIENTKKSELLNKIADSFSMKDKLPCEVICVSPRTFDFEKVERELKWKERDELSSSRFASFNLYSDKVKFVLFDILPKDNKQYRFDLLRFLCMVLVVANNKTPQDTIRSGNVYRTQMKFDYKVMSDICAAYIGKLRATQIFIKEMGVQLENDAAAFVDNSTVQDFFESDVTIPVELPPDRSEGDLYAKYSGIGLSKDCPMEENSYWLGQFKEISKRFVRYLREPKRAVKSAVSESLRSNNTIEDDRTLLLNENQREDIEYHIDELEQRMVETTTTNLFDTKKFIDEIGEADKEIRRGIGQRMTRKKTMIVGLIAVLAYFVGFLPMVFSNLNTVKSFAFSFMLTGITMAALLVVGFIFLFVLRRRLVNRFKHFNYVMSGICNRINDALAQFSRYISSACNVMRDFSVLRKRDSKLAKTKKILSYHSVQIEDQIKAVYETFYSYVDFDRLVIENGKPYDYDFTILRDYAYEMPDVHSRKMIEYLQLGNEISVPLAYVDSITLIREELYD